MNPFPRGGPALEAIWFHLTICQAKPPRPPFSTGCSREPLGCDLGRDETDAIGIANAHSYVSFHQGNGASGQLESHQVGLYLLKQVGAMYLLGSANYGYNDLDVTRTAPLGFVSASAARSIALLAGLLAGSTSPAKKSGFQKIPDFGRVRTFWQIPCNLRPETPQDTA